VADYLLGALEAGGVAIVIATAGHRRAFEGRLRSAGVDLAAATERGTYQAFDAEDTVRRFMAEQAPDAADFDRVIGGVIARACSSGRPVRAYGEMVALLWANGQVNAAIELEELWNELGRRYPFALFCAYPVHAVVGGENLDAFAEVCRLHREVVGPPPGGPTLRTFALSRSAPAAARHFALRALPGLGAEDLADDVALVVTELAANAVLHARTGFTVALAAGPDLLRISVKDGDPAGTPRAAPLHGLGAVDALALRWGVEPLGAGQAPGAAGKEVWVELRR
jgi:hypothetical protein